jgi:hypothetical protein
MPAIGFKLRAMRLLSRLLLPILIMAPAAASAELPQFFGLEGPTRDAIQRLLVDAGYPLDSITLVEGAIIGAAQERVQPALAAYRFREPGVPFVNASSRQAGRCQQVETTIWLPDGTLPALRLRGRYCEHGTPGYSHIWRATAQHMRVLDEDEPLPALVPPEGALVDGS